MFNIAQAHYIDIEERYDMEYANSSILGTRLIYGYDSTIAFAKTLEILDNKYGLRNIFKNREFNLIGNISDIILRQIEFESVTGLVAFNNDTGDRDNGLYSFGYITEYGDIDYFGYSRSYLKQEPVEIWGGSQG